MFVKFQGAFAAVVLAGITLPAMGNDVVDAFVQAPGFEPIAVDPLWDQLHEALPASSHSIQRATANLSSAALAALALELTESPLPRQRQQVRQGVIMQNEDVAGAAPVSLVEITRFNLGPAVRQDLVESLGEAQVAPLSEFGEGPHVVWRLATQELQGNRAALIAASRRVLTEAEAAALSCMGEPCLTPYNVVLELAPWPEPEGLEVDEEWARLATLGGGAHVAAALQHLQGEVEGEAVAIESSADVAQGSVLRNEAVVELGLGQDDGMDSAWRHGGLMDDSIKAQWQRLLMLPLGGEAALVAGSLLWECRRGDESFAPPGQFCP